MREERAAIDDAIRACRQALAHVSERRSFRLRTLVEMLLLELERERARLAREDGKQADQ